MTERSPGFIYLHGFASSPGSTKARAFAAWAKAQGLRLDVLDLRLPTFERLRFSAMKAAVRAAIDGVGGPRARVVLLGSSLGGLLASRVAEEDPRVASLFLMAPAFRLAERWRGRLGPAAFEDWQQRGFLEVDDYATKTRARVDFGFLEELERLDGEDAAAGREAWPDVRVPTTIVHGTRDEVVGIDLSRTFAANKRHVRLIEVDDGHELGASIPKLLDAATHHLASFLG